MDSLTKSILTTVANSTDAVKPGVAECVRERIDAADEDEFDEETMCGVLVDLDSRCGKPITRIVEEPWTPGRFRIKCCDECAQGFLNDGYHDRGRAEIV